MKRDLDGLLIDNYYFELKKVYKAKIYEGIKRTFDIACALLGLIIAMPLLIVIGVLIKLDSKGKVIINQQRIGKNGKTFKFYKFRSMYINAEEVLCEILKTDNELSREYKINKKIKNDPRVTKIGRLIRKTSLDELPQLLNVLLGNMSIVGNRPYLLREKEDMGRLHDVIVSTKPGITGYWQVNGRSNTTFKERLKLEYYYSLNRSMKMDIKILIKTFVIVFNKNGAK